MRFSYATALAAVTFSSVTYATIDNSKAADTFTEAAVTLVAGDYTLTNVQTGQSITYVESGRQFFPSNGDASSIQFTIHPSGPYMRIAAGGKCLSAQWGYDEGGKGIGADHAGVLYTCAVGSGADSGSTVEKDKQWWLMVPVAPDVTTSNLKVDAFIDVGAGATNWSTVANTTAEGCKKSQGWIRRHPLYVNGPKYQHTECASLLRDDQRAALGLSHLSRRARHQEVANQLQRRADATDSTSVNGGTFYIITLDHLEDMDTRAMTGTAKTIEGSQSVDLEIYEEGNTLQQWVLTSSS